MSAPSVTWTFANATTSDATQVNTNFTDLINACSDGTRDFTIGSLIVNGAVTFKGTVTLGDASSDDLTFTGSIASSVPIKANATYNIGGSTTGLLSVYLGNGTKTTRIMAGTIANSYTITLPTDVPSLTGKTMIFDASAVASFRYPDKFTVSKTGTYTATGDETIIPCDGSGGGFTVNLPAASTATGKQLKIIRTDNTIANAVTIDGNASETINGALTYALYTQYECVTIACDGSNWFVVSKRIPTTETNAGALVITGSTSNPSKGSIGYDTFKWWRVGSYCGFRYDYKQTSAGTAGSGDYIITLPTGLTIDTAKVQANNAAIAGSALTTFTVLGAGALFDATNGNNGHVYCATTSTIKLWFPGIVVWGSSSRSLGTTALEISMQGHFPHSTWTD